MGVVYACTRASVPSAKSRPAVGPLPAARVVMPRSRRVPLYVVGSAGEEETGYGRAGLVGLREAVGRRTSQSFRILWVVEL